MNLAVKECLSKAQQIDIIRSLINLIRCSEKRPDIFENVKLEHHQKEACMTDLDVATLWSPTFTMIETAYKCRSVPNDVCSRIHAIQSSLLSYS